MAKGRKGTRRRGGSPSSLIRSAATKDSLSSSLSEGAPQQGRSAEGKRKKQGEKLKIQSTTAKGRPLMLDQPVKMAPEKGSSLQFIYRDCECKEVSIAKKRRAHKMIQMQQVPQPIGRNFSRRTITKERLMEESRQADEELRDSHATYDEQNTLLYQAFELKRDSCAQYDELQKICLTQKDYAERLIGIVQQLCLRLASCSGDPKFVPPSFPSDDDSNGVGGNDEGESDG